MATASNNSPTDDDVRSLLECPVCVAIFQNPKSLRCGHSVCFECCKQLRTAMEIICPVCRTKTSWPSSGGLPTNFALQDLIEHRATHREGKKHNCRSCERRFLVEEIWICRACDSALLCANCAIKDHRGHDLQMLSVLISRRGEELADWRQRMSTSVRELDGQRGQVDANSVRLEQRSITLNSILRTQLEPRFSQAIRDLNAERDSILTSINDVDVSDIISSSSNESGDGDLASVGLHSQFENRMNEVPMKIEALKTKQEQILADQRLALEVVQNCSEVLRQMVSTSPNSRQTSDQSTASRVVEQLPRCNLSSSLDQGAMARRVRRGGLSDCRIFEPVSARGDGGRAASEVFVGARNGQEQRHSTFFGNCSLLDTPVPANLRQQEVGAGRGGTSFFSPPRGARMVGGGVVIRRLRQPEGDASAARLSPMSDDVMLMVEEESPAVASNEPRGAAGTNASANDVEEWVPVMGVDVVSDEEPRIMFHLGGAGRGAPVAARHMIFGSARAPSIGGGRGRGSIIVENDEGGSTLTGIGRGRVSISRDNEQRPQEQYISMSNVFGRPTAAQENAGTSGSNSGNVNNEVGLGFRFLGNGDSSDEDVSEAITFNTFLPSQKNADKGNRQE